MYADAPFGRRLAMRMMVFNASSGRFVGYFFRRSRSTSGPSLAGSRLAVPSSASVWIDPD